MKEIIERCPRRNILDRKFISMLLYSSKGSVGPVPPLRHQAAISSIIALVPSRPHWRRRQDITIAIESPFPHKTQTFIASTEINTPHRSIDQREPYKHFLFAKLGAPRRSNHTA